MGLYLIFIIFFLFQELNGPKNEHEAKYAVVVKLLESVTARYVRFIPTSAPSLRVMRAELYGCMAEPLPPYDGKVFLRIGSCLACVYQVMDARGKFGERERSVRVRLEQL